MNTITLNPIYLFMPEQHENQDHNNSGNHYIPGACNIGKEEIKRRKIAGWSGLILTLITVFLLLWFNTSQMWRLVVFIPAVMSATGFIQAYNRFCVYFGFGHIFNFGEVGKTDTIEQATYRKQDRQRAWQLLFYATSAGLIITLIFYFLP